MTALPNAPGITPEEAFALVAQYGSIDKAAAHSPLSVGVFRDFCRENGITARRRPSSFGRRFAEAFRSPSSSADYLEARDDLVVYFIRAESGQIKIGVSVDVVERLQDLQSASPSRLELLGTVSGGLREEGRLHRKFAAHRLHGEWFSEDIRFDVAKLLQAKERVS